MDKRKKLNIIGLIILALGLVSAVVIYLLAPHESDAGFGYETVNGNVYVVQPENSKKYVHDLEMYGGKAAVLAADINRWFEGLWQGESLAYTVAFLSLVTAAGFFFVSRHLPGDDEVGESSKNSGQ